MPSFFPRDFLGEILNLIESVSEGFPTYSFKAAFLLWFSLIFYRRLDKQDDFGFDIVNFPFLDGVIPRSASYGVYISQLIRFARVSSHVDDFNTRNKVLTAKLLRQRYRYHKLRKAFSKF